MATEQEIAAMLALQSTNARLNPQLQDEIQTARDAATQGPPAPAPELPGGQDLDISRNDVTYDDKFHEDRLDLQIEADKGGVLGTVGRTFWNGGNIAVNVGKEIFRKSTAGPADPSWQNNTINEWVDARKDKISPDQRWRYFGTINSTEAEALLADQQADEHAMKVNALRGGFEQFGAGVLAGLVDVDSVLTVATGGWSAAAKIGLNASKAGRLLAGTASGAMMGVSLGTLDYAVNPNSEAESIWMMGALGGGFGLVGGALSKGAAPNATAEMQTNLVNEIGEQMQAGKLPDPSDLAEPVFRKPVAQTLEPSATGTETTAQPPAAFTVDQVSEANANLPADGDLWSPNSTAGAQQAPGAKQFDGPGINTVTDKETKQMILDAVQQKRTDPLIREWDDPDFNMTNAVTEGAGRAATRFRDAIAKAGITSDFDKLMRSGLATAQVFATTVLESASRIAGGRTTAATMKESYYKELQTAFSPYSSAFREWHYQEQGYKWNSWMQEQPGTGSWKSKDQFNEAVIADLMGRRFGGTSTAPTSLAVRKAADALEAAWKKEYEIGLGRPGQGVLDGYDQFTPEAGYFPQVWSGRKMAEMLDDASKRGGNSAKAAARQKLINTLDDEYAMQAPSWNPKKRKIAATAVIDRALASRRGFQRDLIALLSGDEGEFIKDALNRNGLNPQEIDAVMNAIVGSRKDKTQLSQTKGRQDVDFRSTSKHGIRMFDMLETDIELVFGKRAHRTSGLAALARTGITSRVEFEKLKKAILAEQEARGKRIQRPVTPGQTKLEDFADRADDFIDNETEITPEYLDAIYGYFSGNRVGAGANGDAVVQRIKKITQLSLMNQLGLTSLGEHGAIAGTVGWSRWWEHMSQDLKDQFGKTTSPLMQELKHFAVFVPEETLFSGRLLHDLDRAEAGAWGQKLDAVLNKGVELQGIWSGFYAVRAQQQRVAISSVTARLFEGIKNSADGFSPERMKDMGFDNAFMQRVLPNATFDAQGRLVKLNMDTWSPDDVSEFQNVMARVTNQLVQKAMAGESNWAFQANGVAQLFFQLKSFPLLAVNKQFTRHMRLADKETLQTYIYGLVLAGAAFAAKETINARPENLTPERIARGAMNYSNMLGWIPMVADPVLSSIGSDMSVSGYSSRGAGSIVSLPASFSVLDRLAHLPGAAGKFMLGLPEKINTGDQDYYSKADVRVIQSIPLFGNAYGINALLNMAKQ